MINIRFLWIKKRILWIKWLQNKNEQNVSIYFSEIHLAGVTEVISSIIGDRYSSDLNWIWYEALRSHNLKIIFVACHHFTFRWQIHSNALDLCFCRSNTTLRSSNIPHCEHYRLNDRDLANCHAATPKSNNYWDEGEFIIVRFRQRQDLHYGRSGRRL